MSQKMDRKNGPVARGQEEIFISKALSEEPIQSSFIPFQIFYNLFHYALVLLAKLTLGQFYISIFDFYVVKLEQTLRFCVPQDPNDVKTGDTKKEPERPMNWLLFLPILMMVRVVRFYLSVFSIVKGTGEVTAEHMDNAVLEFRRYYRSVRHYRIASYSARQEEYKARRCEHMVMWQVIYKIYELLVMTRPPVDTQRDLELQKKIAEEQAKAPRTVPAQN